MTTNLKMLRFVGNDPIRHPKDVARLRRILNDRGYDASDADIQQAYSSWSEATHCAGWLGVDGMSDDALMAIMWKSLRKERRRTT